MTEREFLDGAASFRARIRVAARVRANREAKARRIAACLPATDTALVVAALLGMWSQGHSVPARAHVLGAAGYSDASPETWAAVLPLALHRADEAA